MTSIGVQALAAELDRYQRVVTIAQQRQLFPKSSFYGA